MFLYSSTTWFILVELSHVLLVMDSSFGLQITHLLHSTHFIMLLFSHFHLQLWQLIISLISIYDIINDTTMDTIMLNLPTGDEGGSQEARRAPAGRGEAAGAMAVAASGGAVVAVTAGRAAVTASRGGGAAADFHTITNSLNALHSLVEQLAKEVKENRRILKEMQDVLKLRDRQIGWNYQRSGSQAKENRRVPDQIPRRADGLEREG